MVYGDVAATADVYLRDDALVFPYSGPGVILEGIFSRETR